MVCVGLVGSLKLLVVSVPIRGLFNLTVPVPRFTRSSDEGTVSVPIRGLFNLTHGISKYHTKYWRFRVSVPIRGLFNLTEFYKTAQT